MDFGEGNILHMRFSTFCSRQFVSMGTRWMHSIGLHRSGIFCLQKSRLYGNIRLFAWSVGLRIVDF